MTNEELLKLISASNLDLHQQFTISKFKKGIEGPVNVDELKELLIEAMKQIMAKDNMIKVLMKKAI